MKYKPSLAKVIKLTFSPMLIIFCITGTVLAKDGKKFANSDAEITLETSVTLSIQPSMSLISSETAASKKIDDRITIKGKVIDEQGTPIPGATVKLKGTNEATASNLDGEYALTIKDEPGTLVFSFIGYQNKEVNIGNNRVINVSLSAEAGSLNEVVVVGYGTQKKATLTGSVVAVKGEDVVKSPAINVAGSLAGKLPGVIINSRLGEPGRDDPSISIRG